MAIPTPYVYKTQPASKEAKSYIDGLRYMLNYPGVSHHWQEVSYNSTSVTNTELIIECILTPSRVIRYFTTTRYELRGFLSLDGGATYVNPSGTYIGNTISAYQMSSTAYGASDLAMYLLETEDMICIGASGKDGTNLTGILAGALGMSLMGGRILQMHNKNDESYGITGEGMWGGVVGIYTGNQTFSWLTSGGTTLGGAWWGSWTPTRYASGTLVVPGGSYPHSAPVKDGTIRKYVPMMISGAGPPGSPGFSKYFRFANWAVGAADPLYGTIANGQVLPTPDPNVSWRYSRPIAASTLTNTVIIWAPTETTLPIVP